MKNKSVKAYSLLALKGAAMGAADVVPGVSGGTIALLTGIYDELLHSLKQLTPAALVTLYKRGPIAFWEEINGSFLLVLFAGIVISIKTFAGLIAYCLENYPLMVWGFFSGLIAASVILLWRKQTTWNIKEWLAFALGVAAVVLISLSRPAELPESNLLLFGGGFIAIIAMILPGISGSFILLLLGMYSTLLAAVNNNNIAGLLCFMAGAASGLMVFSRFLSWLLDNFHRVTLAVLIGFLVGSLSVTWPWKVVLESYINRHGESVALVQRHVLPSEFSQLTQLDAQLVPVLSMVFVGVMLVLLTEVIAARFSSSDGKD